MNNSVSFNELPQKDKPNIESKDYFIKDFHPTGGLNPDFVDKDMDLDYPDGEFWKLLPMIFWNNRYLIYPVNCIILSGIEGPVSVYVKPPPAFKNSN